ncbi:hypothetical protein [Roseovarius sp. D22-M7]|uniref:hypothetical protein n=1 Tax=Roseovarius sp. D22-M7 TaxID=3127116 RepID=UPI0030100848
MKSRVLPVLAGFLISAAPALADSAGLYCAYGGNSFLIARQAGTNAVDLRISSWQGMHHCGVQGTATAAPDGSLLEARGCMLRLREESGAIMLEASPHEACAQFCGARARLNGLSFPQSSRITARADPALFARDLGELDPC